MSKYPGRIVSNLAPAGYSVYFDGTGDYLSVADNAALDMGSSDFTIEFWTYLVGTPSTYQAYFAKRANTGTYGGVELYLTSGRTLNLQATLNGSSWGVDITTTSTVPFNTWTHIAAVRNGNTWVVYVNGTAGATSGTVSGTVPDNANTFVIGAGASDGSHVMVASYISNFRVVKGTALYTAAFTPPTQLFNITNTSLLTCNSPALVDQSTNNFTITANGNAAVSTLTPFTAYVPYNPALGASTPGIWTVDEALQAKGTRQWNMYDPNFPNTTLLLHGNPTNGTAWLTDVSTNNFALTINGDAKPANLSPFSLTTYDTSGSGYFDGTGDYLSNTSAALISNTVSTFTVECWVYLTANPPANGNDISALCTLDGQPTGPTNFLSFGPKDNRRLYLFWFDGAVKSAAGNTAIALNTWTHIACVVNSNSIQFYVNGVAETMSGTTTLTNRSGSQGNFAIGSSSAGQITGYISNFRVTTTAVYTGAFTTPTAPLTAISGTRILTLQNSQSANNNAFLDSSSNNFLITRNGNTTQGSFSPFSQGGWSNYFDGTGDYLTVPNNAAFNLSTNDFTLELFWYPTTFQAGSLIECSSTSNYAFAIYAQASGAVQFYAGTGASASWNILSAIAMGTATLNAWNHIVVVRSGTTFSYYLNGTRTGQSTSVSAAIGQQAIGIGGNSVGASITGPGYISNIRLVNGTAVYSGTTLTVPTAPLTTTSQGATASQVELLTCQSNRFIDNSDNAFTITRNGDTSVQAFSPFYPTAAYTPQTIGGSGYFDGTGDYLTWSGSSIGTNTFIAECWFYLTSTAFSAQYGLFGASTTNGFGLRLINTTTANVDWLDVAAQSFTLPATLVVGNWYHIAAVRNSSNQTTVFLNGVRSTSGAVSVTTNFSGSTSAIGLAAANANYGPMFGYIASARLIIGGTPIYDPTQTTITVPTAPLTAITNTSLLLNFTNAGIVDSTAKNVLETVGNAQISTTQSRFGGSSMYFDGTGDSLATAPSQLFNLGFSDFTIEFWVYPTSFAVTSTPLYSTSARAKTDTLAIQISTGGIVYAYVSAAGGGTWSIMNAGNLGTVTLNAWNHVAFVRNGSSWRGYVNGVQGPLSTSSSSAVSAFDGFNIGTDGAGGQFYTGYIDDLRITRFARYTAAFTPQTSQWQDQ